MRIRSGIAHVCVCCAGMVYAHSGAAAGPPVKDPQTIRTSAAWQLPDDRIGVRTAPILLLSRDDVANDLKLTAEQRQKAWEMIADLGRRAAELKGRSDQDALVLRRQIDQSQLEWLSRELTTEQYARLHQIDLQWEGPLSLVSRPQIATAVHLTEEQQNKIRSILEASPRPSNRSSDLGKRQDVLRRIFMELDETQQQTWRSLTGPDFFAVPQTAASK